MKRKRENKNLSEWAVSEEVVDFLENNLKENCTIIEFGSGSGSIEIEKNFNLWSIEHNNLFLYKNTLQNVYAPIKKYKKINPTLKTDIKEYKWYNEETVENVMNKINYECILVDGPPGCIGREGFLHNLNKFNTNCLIIIDDVNRTEENKLLYDVSKKLSCKYTVYHCSDGKSFGVIDNR